MTSALRQSLSGKTAALLALGIPVLAGIAYLAAFGAPQAYWMTNAAALAGAMLLVLVGLPRLSMRGARVAMTALIAAIVLPLLIGPEVSGVTRWISVGPVTLHTGSLFIPALAVLASRDGDYAAAWLGLAVVVTLRQPDAASVFALTGAAVGIYMARGDWKVGLVVVAGFFAGILAALRGELPAQPFVERVLVDLVSAMPALALGLLLALVAGFYLMSHGLARPKHERFALAGTLFGFSLMAILSNYPSVLIGYGASPILGYGLALSLRPGE
ncbi:hypothetical protein [Erythrobacter sp. HKB08]|uniref:hypothetical protein n=1 Tax=Erythrobacter sp. HKB08 TaxID=2502843 RepID=UPI0010089DB2|nr:hypothetical protein [Erythrobacter sp. HKB08]